MTDYKEKMVELLVEAYTGEIETTANYIANAVYLDGILSEEVREELLQDVEGDEIQHAIRLADRIAFLGGRPPYSKELNLTQSYMKPPEDTTDYVTVARGVVQAEKEGIELYKRIVKLAQENEDYVTAKLATELLEDEEEHLSEFEGYLVEAEKM
jgi:bacterioferritin